MRARSATGREPCSAFYRAVNRNKRSSRSTSRIARGRDAFLALAQRRRRHRRELSARRRRRARRGLRRDRGDQSPHRLCRDLRLRADRTARAPRRATTSTTSATPACSTRPARAMARPRCPTCRSPTSWAAPHRAAIALLAALLGAQRTGRGRYVDVAMADASLAHNIFALHALEQWGRVLPRGDGPPDRRRALLRRLSDAGRALARRRRARGEVLAGAVRDARAARSRRRPVRARGRRRARARASSNASSPARRSRHGRRDSRRWIAA